MILWIVALSLLVGAASTTTTGNGPTPQNPIVRQPSDSGV